MAFRAGYHLRETGRNLFRNPSLSVATILTVAVSLSLMGAALLVQQAVGNLNHRFQDNVEFVVWMDIAVEDGQIRSTEDFLISSPYIASVRFVNQEETWEEFQNFYRDEPEILELVTPDQLPTSFLVVPTDADVGLIEDLAESITDQPGVEDVEFVTENIENIETFSRLSSLVMLIAAILSAIAAALLMYNTIRTAVFARRREIEVMRLVGATKWFIRIPFMLEGLAQGVVGAVMSFVSVFVLNLVFDRFFGDLNIVIFRDFALANSALLPIFALLLVVGGVLGTLGAGIAVTRYLDA